MIAGGPIVNQNSVGDHGPFFDISENMHWLYNPGIVQGARKSPLLLTHGALMIIAWICITSMGVVFARYFKPVWSGRQILGKDIWFFCHVGSMFLTAILTLIGFIIIIVDMGHWNTTVHSVLGCIVFALVFLQSIGGIMR